MDQQVKYKRNKIDSRRLIKLKEAAEVLQDRFSCGYNTTCGTSRILVLHKARGLTNYKVKGEKLNEWYKIRNKARKEIFQIKWQSSTESTNIKKVD